MPNIDKHVPGTCAWVDLMSDDTEASRQFYGALFDWTFEIGVPESGPYTICHRGGRRVAGIGTKPPNTPMPNCWSTYITVDSADATAAKIKEAGGSMMMEPFDVFDQGRMAIATDSTGAAFGLWQPMKHSGHQVENEPGSFAWHEVYTRDLQKAVDFYVKVFGYKPVNLDGAPYVTLHLGPDDKIVAGGVMQMDDKFPEDLPPHWNIYFATDDTDRTVARVLELGGKQLAPAFDTPYGRMAVVADAQGAAFSVIKLPPT